MPTGPTQWGHEQGQATCQGPTASHVCLQNANNVLLISSRKNEKGFESKVSILWLDGSLHLHVASAQSARGPVLSGSSELGLLCMSQKHPTLPI